MSAVWMREVQMVRKWCLLACVAGAVHFLLGGQALAQSLLQLDYRAKVFGTIEIADGAIDITNSAMILDATSAFGFVPVGGQLNEYGTPGVPEYGDNAIHDAIEEGTTSPTATGTGLTE